MHQYVMMGIYGYGMHPFDVMVIDMNTGTMIGMGMNPEWMMGMDVF